jgi:hypothetical protein
MPESQKTVRAQFPLFDGEEFFSGNRQGVGGTTIPDFVQGTRLSWATPVPAVTYGH